MRAALALAPCPDRGPPASLMAMTATGNEPALTPAETARLARRAVIDVGAAFGHEVSFAETGRRLGLDPRAFYFGARAAADARVTS